ncbi:hypothetical protein QUF82_01995 [Thiotrichales bacterium HSG14]|nr:hypothetical protein [Thiotrichales bacterium HSG14]
MLWADDKGLFTVDIEKIDNGVCVKIEIVASSVEVESLTWDNMEKVFYAALGKLYINLKMAR